MEDAVSLRPAEERRDALHVVRNYGALMGETAISHAQVVMLICSPDKKCGQLPSSQWQDNSPKSPRILEDGCAYLSVADDDCRSRLPKSAAEAGIR